MVEVEYGPDADDDEDESPLPWLRWMTVELGSVRAVRRMSSGREDELGSVEVRVHIEPDDHRGWSGIRVRTDERDGETPRCWDDALTKLVHGIVRALCDGTWPPPDTLSQSEPALDAEALVRDGWVERGAAVYDSVAEDWWEAGHAIDLPRLLAAIARGESHRRGGRWAAHRRSDGGAVLVWPLVAETFRVELRHLGSPRWLTTRYWLAVDVGGDGALRDVSIATDRDATWDAEGDDDRNDVSLADRLSENAYGALLWILEDFGAA